MNLFGCKFCRKSYDQKESCDRKNFDSLLWAIVTVFQVLSPAHRVLNENKKKLPSTSSDESKSISKMNILLNLVLIKTWLNIILILPKP